MYINTVIVPLVNNYIPLQKKKKMHALKNMK